jgi:hypothetical protein
LCVCGVASVAAAADRRVVDLGELARKRASVDDEAIEARRYRVKRNYFDAAEADAEAFEAQPRKTGFKRNVDIEAFELPVSCS